jgi:UDP-N-acetylglucosamine 1-carboxyvinyltransferase
MKKLEVFGAAKLKGQIRISGSKNASLPILAATLLSDKRISLTNLPKVQDIETMILLLKSLGSSIEKNKKTLTINNNKQTKTFAAYSLVKQKYLYQAVVQLAQDQLIFTYKHYQNWV